MCFSFFSCFGRRLGEDSSKGEMRCAEKPTAAVYFRGGQCFSGEPLCFLSIAFGSYCNFCEPGPCQFMEGAFFLPRTGQFGKAQLWGWRKRQRRRRWNGRRHEI